MRTLKINRAQLGINSLPGNLVYKLDGATIGMSKKLGDVFSMPIDQMSHTLKVTQLSAFGTPTIGSEPAELIILAGKMDCSVTASLRALLLKNKVFLEASYDMPPLSEEDFIRSVTEFMVQVFSGDAILERLNDPNNRRNDLEVFCAQDGIHIRWQEKQPTEWSKGYAEETIPYEAAQVSLPKDALTPALLDRLNRAVHSGILSRTRFENNQYGCFMLGTKKSSLY